MSEKNNLEILHINLASGWRGGENQTYLLIEALSKKGHKQTVICKKKSSLREAVNSLENVVCIPPLSYFQPSLFKDIQIIHAHEARATYLAFFIHLIQNIPYIITRRMDKPPKKRPLTKLVYSNAAALVGISRAASKAIAKHSQAQTPIIIPSSHSGKEPDFSESKFLRSKLLGEKKYLIGHAGALIDKHKGQSILIEAKRILENKGFELSLIFLGKGPDEETLKSSAEHDTSIHFLGHVPDITNHIRALDIFVFPSREEGLGSVLLDVMLCKTPIIASNVGGIPDIIIDEKNGVLFEKDNASDLAEKMEYMLKNSGFRNSVTEKAYCDSQKYSPNIMADRYENLYIEIATS